jgi:excisionase family DNA binding protein
MDQLLMRAEEVGRALGLGRSKAYELMTSGQLPVVRVGRALRVPRSALEEWVRKQTQPAGDRAVSPRR